MSLQQRKHILATRFMHAGTALAVTFQLADSLVMQGPGAGQPSDLLFQFHQYGGLVATGFITAFWLVMIVRKRGTSFRRLFPWLSGLALKDLGDDLRRHFSALKRLRLPDHVEDGPLASAVHGLGLLLVTAMAVTGTIFYLAGFAGAQSAGTVRLILEVHQLLGNLVWAYLIGHAGLGIAHHLTRQASLSEMWSLRRNA